MFRIAIFALLALTLTSAAALAAATCAGPDPAIGAVTVSGVSSNGGLNDYHITGTVSNLGNSSQDKDVLQSVDIYLDSEKLDAKSIPPLAAGQSATFDYVYQRSKDAGKGTTRLRFALDMHNPAGTAQDCSTKNDQAEINF